MIDEPTDFQIFIKQNKEEIAAIEERLMNTRRFSDESFYPEAWLAEKGL